MRDHGQTVDTDHWHLGEIGEGSRGCETDTHPGEQPRTHVDGDRAEIVNRHPQVAEQHRHGGNESLDVAAVARNGERRIGTRRIADSHTHLLGCGVDRKNLHRPLQSSTM